MMEHSFFDLEGYRIHYIRIPSRQPPRGAALFLPGHGAPAESYAKTLDLFSQAGIICYAIDIPGQGKSSGKRGDLSSISLVDELLTALYQIVKNDTPHLPIGIMGHSMGGHFVLRALFQHPSRYQFCWLNAPLIAPEKRKSKIELFLLKKLAPIAPKLMTTTGVTRSHCIPEPRQSKGANSTYHNTISLRMGFSLLQSCGELRQKLKTLSLPLFVTQGDQDSVTPLETAVHFFDHLSAPQLYFQIITDGLHEAFRGSTQNEFEHLLLKWLDGLDCIK